MSNTKSNTRQLLIHFNGEEQKKILAWFEKRAKADFRTVEQEIVFELHGVYDMYKHGEDDEITDEEIKKFERVFNGPVTVQQPEPVPVSEEVNK